MSFQNQIDNWKKVYGESLAGWQLMIRRGQLACVKNVQIDMHRAWGFQNFEMPQTPTNVKPAPSKIDDIVPEESQDGEVEEVSPKSIPSIPQNQATTDDLTLIEGIGKKIAEVLNAAGIDSFSDLSKYTKASLEAILEDAGGRYKSHDPTTWAEQAELAASGKMKQLKALQKELKGGKRK